MEEFLADNAGRLATLTALLGLSAFFSSSETALFGLSRVERQELAGRGAGAAHRLLDDPRALLATILFGNLVVNVLFYATATVLALEASARWGAGAGAAFAFAGLALVVLFGEVTPKIVAVAARETMARIEAMPLLAFHYAITPVRAFLAWVMARIEPRAPARAHLDADELRMLVDLAGKHGALAPGERRLVEEAVGLSTLRVREIMVPRVDMVACEGSMPARRLLALAAQHTVTRLPVYRNSLDEILGVAHVREVLRAGRSDAHASEFARPARFVPESLGAAALHAELRAAGEEMAVVVDEYGGTAGLVTLEDTLEAVIGRLDDEFDAPEPPAVREVAPGRYVLAGDLAISDWEDLFDIDVGELPVDRLGGLVTALLGRVPARGDRVRFRNLRFTVERMRGRRVAEVHIELDTNDGKEEA